MRLSGSRGVSQRRKARIRRELRVFAWNLRTLDTPFARRSLALNAIEHGRAWHWRILPAGWADPAFVLRHGQLKTKRAFAWFFRSSNPTVIQPPKQTMRVMLPPAGEAPLAWETVKAVFAQNPKLKRWGVLAGAQALLNEHLENSFGRRSFDIDLHTSRDLAQINASLTPAERKRIRLVSRANPEMYLYEIGTRLGPVKLELARPYLLPKFAPVRSKHIPGLKITQLADLLAAKISALSARGFARDLLDLYLAHTQIHSDWRSLLLKASRNQQNDYNPIELENNLSSSNRNFGKAPRTSPASDPLLPVK